MKATERGLVCDCAQSPYLIATPICTSYLGHSKWFCVSHAIKFLFQYLPFHKTKRRTLYIKTQAYRAVNTFHLVYKNQSVYAVSGTSRCLFSDKYKTHKYSVGRA